MNRREPVNRHQRDSMLDSVWGTPPVAGSDSMPALRELVLRLGLWRMCLSITLLGVLASVSLSLIVNAFTHRTSAEVWLSLLTSAGIPALIAPPVTWLVMRLLLEAETARRVAERMAMTDALTGAFNRGHFFIAGERRFARCTRLQEQISVLLLDIDDFKAVNDQHGHAVGDRVLIEVARVCMNCMRESDLLARFGGEEFVALLPATELTRALQVAERIRASVAGAQVATDSGSPVRPTVSIGVAMLTSAPDSLDGLLARADTAMYSAKRSGKNRVGASQAALGKATNSVHAAASTTG